MMVFTFCLAIGLNNTVRSIQSIRWIQRETARSLGEGSLDVEFVILLPLLREMAVVKRLLRRMAAMRYLPGKLRFALVTTSREDYTKGPTTRGGEEQ
jgi:hypothetical protein